MSKISIIFSGLMRGRIIESIIDGLSSSFNAYDIIKKIPLYLYNIMLNEYKYNGKDAVRIVHSQIARLLSKNSEELNIFKGGRVSVVTAHGTCSTVEVFLKK